MGDFISRLGIVLCLSRAGLFCFGTVSFWILASGSTASVEARTWSDIDALRTRLSRAGVNVVQRDCPQRGLQGSYHPRSDTLVVCRSHSDPNQVWDTLAHEATHRMQQCAGGAITKRDQHRALYVALSRSHPAEIASLRAYPRAQQLSELEARYTAKLPPNQVLYLFDRYCGGQTHI
ncbi:MAG: hypothetical protein RLZZ216_1315 [Cyanobacteriota bacterium]|jgi:hypothetical protein